MIEQESNVKAGIKMKGKYKLLSFWGVGFGYGTENYSDKTIFTTI
jgi:hypothetical protein